MSKAKAQLNNNGLRYWILTNGNNSVVFRYSAHKQGNIIHIDGWPISGARDGNWQVRQARNMWNELIRIGYWVKDPPEWKKGDDPIYGECKMCGNDLKSCHCVE